MSELTEERVVRGDVSLRFFYDEDGGEHANPRGWDQLGTMVCWHSDYVLGDFQLAGDGVYTRRGAVGNVFETARGRTDFRGMRHLERYLRSVLGAVVVVPLYLYDHSGISMSAGAPSRFDNPVVSRDELGVGLGWDSSMVGFIFSTRDRVAELCGDPDYKPAGYAGDPVDWLADQLRAEVEEYDLFLTGQVYGYRVERGGEELDSCWGFLGFDSVREEGLAALDVHVRDAEREASLEESEVLGGEAFAPERLAAAAAGGAL